MKRSPTFHDCSVKGPVPISFLLQFGASSWAWPMIPRRALLHRNHGDAGHGRLVVTLTVNGSTTSTLLMSLNTKMNSSGLRFGYVPRYASRLFFTTVASSAEPSENLMFGRSLIVH